MKANEVELIISSLDFSKISIDEFKSILKTDIIKSEKHLPACFSRSSWVSSHIQPLKTFIDSKIKSNISFPKKLYLILNNKTCIPTCQVCDVDLPESKINLNISPFCSSVCMKTKKGYAIRQKLKTEAVYEKYGVSNVMHDKSIAQLHQAGIQEKDEFASLKKREATNLTKYGYINPMMNTDVQNKGKQTSLIRYGETNYTKTAEYKENCRRKTLASKKYKSNSYEWLYDQYVTNKRTIIQIANDDEIDTTCIDWRLNHFNIERRNDTSKSAYEHQIAEFISSNSEIKVEQNNRVEIHPKELDIYVKEQNFAIELNGIYWHSYPKLSEYDAKNKHLNKSIAARSNGISVFNITDIEWLYQNELVKSMISQRLGFAINRVYGRSCNVALIKSKDANIFFDRTHIQGSTTQQSIAYSLIHKNDIVSVMTFMKKSDTSYELTRFSSELNMQVIGGFSKLLKAFINDNRHVTEITSFLALDFGSSIESNVYVNNGFELVSVLKPDYRYVCTKLFGTRLVHKSNFRKVNLKKVLDSNGISYEYDDTEFDLVDLLNNNRYNISRIYDVGKVKYVYKLL